MGIQDIIEYGGSNSLSFVCEYVKMPIDQVNFIACQLFALSLSFVFKKHVTGSVHGRLWFCMVAGIAITIFCFGSQVGHILFTGAVCYLIIQSQYESRKMPWYVLVFSMLYLSILHWRRQFLEPENYSLDITGPMMVLTQKLISLAFSVRDGKEQSRKKSDDKPLTDLQLQHLVTNVPSVLEFGSFIFQFQSMLAGPLVMYKDFIDFIHRENVPSSSKVVAQKIMQSAVYAVVFLKLASLYPVSVLSSELFLENSNWLKKVALVMTVTTLERFKYYHAWVLADAVCNASGLGYVEDKGTWDLTTNVRPMGVEFGQNFKETLDAWNIGTGKWLRHVMYERVAPTNRTVLTYLLSAFWHGYYPGYYLTFLTGALFTSSARVVRRFCRPIALKSTATKLSYDVLTWFVTRLALAYATFTFMLLDFASSVAVYQKIYFFMHFLAAAAMYGIPPVFKSAGISPAPSRRTTTVTEGTVSSPNAAEKSSVGNNNTNGLVKNSAERISDLLSSHLNSADISASMKTG